MSITQVHGPHAANNSGIITKQTETLVPQNDSENVYGMITGVTIIHPPPPH